MRYNSGLVAVLAVFGLLLGGVGVGYYAELHEHDLDGSGPSYGFDAVHYPGNETLRLEVDRISGQEAYPTRELWVGVKAADEPTNRLNTTRAVLRSGSEVSRNGTWVGGGGITWPPVSINDTVLVTGDGTDRDGDGNAGIEEGDKVVLIVQYRDGGENRTRFVGAEVPGR